MVEVEGLGFFVWLEELVHEMKIQTTADPGKKQGQWMGLEKQGQWMGLEKVWKIVLPEEERKKQAEALEVNALQ